MSQKTQLEAWASQIFDGDSLEDKLKDFQGDFETSFNYNYKMREFIKPSRSQEIDFSSKKIKFPKGNHLLTEKGKAIALHSFANHELLAIEIMAMCLLKFPHQSTEQKLFKKGLVKTLKDEQKHFKMYCGLLKKLGYEFGDFPISDFFWKWAHLIKTQENYLSIMAITFEGANLDFAHYFANFYRQNNEIEIANVLDQVFKDEITHVAFGSHYLDKWREDQSLWDYYYESLPFPMTPARAKGIKFYRQSRIDSGLDTAFVDQLESYTDNFQVTKRKTWKSPKSSESI